LCIETHLLPQSVSLQNHSFRAQNHFSCRSLLQPTQDKETRRIVKQNFQKKMGKVFGNSRAEILLDPLNLLHSHCRHTRCCCILVLSLVPTHSPPTEPLKASFPSFLFAYNCFCFVVSNMSSVKAQTSLTCKFRGAPTSRQTFCGCSILTQNQYQ